MRIMKCALLILLMASALPVWADTVNETTNSGCVSTNPNITSTIDFGPANAPNAVDPQGHATYTTPFFNNGTDTGCGGSFLGLNGGQTTTITFNAPIDYFGLDWGSPDGYNSLELFDGATSIGTYSGNQGGQYVNFFVTSGEITSVVLSSTSCCFETDNHSYHLLAGSPVPEPSTLMELGIGLLVGTASFSRMRKRRRTI